MNISEMREDYDWQEAFKYGADIRTATGCGNAPFVLDDVEEIIASDEGMNDEESWIAVGKLNDGRYFFLSAWCDYTGWG